MGIETFSSKPFYQQQHFMFVMMQSALAAEVNWIEEAKELLIKETSDTYRYPVYSAPLSIAFAQLNNSLDVRGGSESRHLLKTAVLSAVKNDREAVFRLLVPVVGIDFETYCSQDIFYVLTMIGAKFEHSKEMGVFDS